MRPSRIVLCALWFGAGAAMGEGAPEPRHEWRRVPRAGWQIVGGAEEPTALTDAREGNRGWCPAGMVAIEGPMKRGHDADSVEALQDATCLAWEPASSPRRCLHFDRAQWAAVVPTLEASPLRFCIDRFEHPNEKGAYPVIATSFLEATALCGAQGKRLCTEDEWTFACEGSDALPYPYGFDRDDDACVIDRRNPAFDEHALRDRDADRFARELDRLWQGETSGARPRCRSPFGVYDMTGNVDEWTVSVRATGRRSIMKGGYWGRIRARCRPSTRAHGEDFVFYQQGFRCCA